MATSTFKLEIDLPAGAVELDVISFSGYEAISKLYEFEIEAKIHKNHALDLADAIDVTAHFNSIVKKEVASQTHGILSSIEELRRTQKHVYYRMVLVPRIWALSNYRCNRVYDDSLGHPTRTVRDIIVYLLTEAGFVEVDDFDLQGVDTTNPFLPSADYPGGLLERDYRCQFGESDFDFIARLAENEGIFFYFDHGDPANGDKVEKIVFMNNQDYDDPSLSLDFEVDSQSSNEHNSINAWSCRQQRLPANLRTRDYHHDLPSLDISETVLIDADDQSTSYKGDEYLYGEYLKIHEEAEYLGDIRAQECLARKTRFYGESAVSILKPGYLFELVGHAQYPGKYLVLEINHQGEHLDMALSDKQSTRKRKVPEYRNSIVAVSEGVVFRPDRGTPKPRFYGTMSAFIHATDPIHNIEISAEGYYQVNLPFDQLSGPVNADPTNTRPTTHWIRMAQPSVGKDQGTYFPLKGGTEVLLSFINGDPDRPVITAALPNGNTPSLLTTTNDTESIIQTTGPLIEKLGISNSSTPPDFTRLENSVIKESGILKNNCPVPPDHDDTEPVKQATYVDGHTKIQTEGSYVIHAQTQYRGQNLETSHSGWEPVTYGDPWLESDGVDLHKPLTDIKFEMLDDRVILDAGNRDMMIKCNHFDVDNVSEINQTEGHDHAVHRGTAFEKFFGNAEEHFIGEKVETFCGTITGLTPQEIEDRQREARLAKDAAAVQLAAAESARKTADASKKEAEESRKVADDAGAAYEGNEDDVDLYMNKTAAEAVADEDERQARVDDENATDLEADPDVRNAKEKAAAVARGKLTATTTDTDIHETFKNCSVTETFNGPKTETHNGTVTEIFNFQKFEFQLGGSESIFIGGQFEFALAETFEIYLGAKQELCLNLIDVFIGTGFKLDLNFSGGFEWAPFMYEANSIQAKKEEVELDTKLAEIKKIKARLNNAAVDLTKAGAKLQNTNLMLAAAKLTIM